MCLRYSNTLYRHCTPDMPTTVQPPYTHDILFLYATGSPRCAFRIDLHSGRSEFSNSYLVFPLFKVSFTAPITTTIYANQIAPPPMISADKSTPLPPPSQTTRCPLGVIFPAANLAFLGYRVNLRAAKAGSGAGYGSSDAQTVRPQPCCHGSLRTR